jgi:hypothetical protein
VGSTVSSYVAYGVPVTLAEGTFAWHFSEDLPRGNAVTLLEAGRYDEDDLFLVISGTCKQIQPGEPVFIGPYQGSEDQYLAWDGLLVAAAEKFKLSVTGQPAWIFAPDRS